MNNKNIFSVNKNCMSFIQKTSFEFYRKILKIKVISILFRKGEKFLIFADLKTREIIR